VELLSNVKTTENGNTQLFRKVSDSKAQLLPEIMMEIDNDDLSWVQFVQTFDVVFCCFLGMEYLMWLVLILCI